MPVTWNDVKRELNELKKLNLQPPFDDMASGLKQLVDAGPNRADYGPQQARALIDAIKAMHACALAGEAPDRILDSVNSGFVQLGLDANTINNLNNRVNNFYFGEARKRVDAKAVNPKVEVPIVLLVMNKKQAKELDDETAFVDLAADFKVAFKQDFDALRPLLPPNWLDRYGKDPEDWKPFLDKPDSIKQWVTEMLDRVRQDNNYPSELAPKFVDISTMNQEWRELVALREKGCIVIEDAVAMRYPAIQREFRRSLLDAFNKIIIIRIVPQAAALDWIQQPMLTWLQSFGDLEFYKRRVDGDDKCREVFTSVDFRGWFKQHVPNLIPNEEKVKNSVAGDIIGRRP